MSVSVKLSFREFSSSAAATLLGRTLFNVTAAGIPLAIIGAAFGSLAAIGAIFVAALIIYILLAVLYIAYKDAHGKVSVTYKVGPGAFEATYGSRKSLASHSIIFDKSVVRRVWLTGNDIFIKDRALALCLSLPEKQRAELIEELDEKGWFDRQPGTLIQWLSGNKLRLAAMLCVSLAMFAAFLLKPDGTPAAANQPAVKVLRSKEIFAVMNEQRGYYKKSPLLADETLVFSADRSCEDMKDRMYFGAEYSESAQSKGEYTSQYYDGQWIVESGVAIVTGYNAGQVVDKVMANAEIRSILLDGNYVRGGVSICDYTADRQYDSIVVIHFAS